METNIDNYVDLPNVCDVEEFPDDDDRDVAKAEKFKLTKSKRDAGAGTEKDTLITDILTLLEYTDTLDKYTFDTLQGLSVQRLTAIHRKLEGQIYG